MSGPSRRVGVMSDADALLWTIGSDPVLRSPIVAVLRLDREPSWEEVRRRVGRLTEIEPRLRARPVPPRFGHGNPAWMVEDQLDLGRHLRRVDAPPPGTVREVLDLAQVMGTAPFDPAFPLWEALLVGGLEDGAAALIVKVHHSVVDGIAGMALLIHLLDRARHPGAGEGPLHGPSEGPVHGPSEGPVSGTAVRAVTGDREPAVDGTGADGTGADGTGADGTAPTPGSPSNSRSLGGLPGDVVALAGSAVAHGLGLAQEVVRSTGHAALHPLASVETVAEHAGSLARLLAPAPTPLSPLLRGRGADRWFGLIDLDAEGLHRAARSYDSTVSEIFVGAVLGGMRQYHHAHGSTVGHLRALVPISIRTESDPAGGNRFVPARFVLAADIADPRDRMRHVAEALGAWKHNPALGETGAVTGLLNRLPPRLATLAFGSMLKGGDFVATSVPGAPFETFLAGARVTGVTAFAPTSGAAVNVALTTPASGACVGVAVDRRAVPDGELLVDCLRRGFEELGVR